MTKKEARRPRQETAARVRSELAGTPFGKFTRAQAFAIGVGSAAFALAVVVLEGVMRAWQ